MSASCESCRWWSPISDEDHEYLAGVVETTGGTRWGRCRFVVDTNDQRDELHGQHSTRAYPQDASGYSAWLEVRSDFGCIEHEPASLRGQG